MMSLLKALIETYDYALQNDLVDNPKLGTNGQVLLPVYHSNKNSSGEDIFELAIDENSKVTGGRFLGKDEVIVFQITEDSITRSGSKIAPHAISDELSYLAKEIDSQKNETYITGIKELLEYEKKNNCENFRIIGKYVIKNTILDDFLRFFLGDKEYYIDKKFNLKFNIDEGGKTRDKTIDLKKLFITFKIEKEFSGDINLTRDVGLHNFYIDYVRNKNQQSRNKAYCNITGKMDYCVERHRGIMGTAKLISISNNDETYYGRIKQGKDIFSISYEASQKVHNMLKYLLENENHRQYIGGDAYVINWLSKELDKGGIDIVSDLNDYDDDFEDIEEITMDELGGNISKKLGLYFSGGDESFSSASDFYILIIEKISNGRVSIKYFRNLSRSDAYEKVMNWYKSTNWKFYGKEKSPSLYQMVNFVYGQENSKGFLSCENKKLSRSTVERLIPCIIDGQKIPKDISRMAFLKLSKRQSYKNSWNNALSIGCSLIKKYKSDYKNCIINPDKISEVKVLKESRSFCYGKLMAIYEKIELDATKGRTDINEAGKEKGKSQRITNSDRLWSSMIRTPERTRLILEVKIRPYINMLKKNNAGSYIFYDKLITGINTEIMKSSVITRDNLNEDFILGYYYQKNEFYKKKGADTN